MTHLPKTIDEWKALPELPPGRYLVINLGIMDASLVKCRAANVEGLPPPDGDEPELAVRLPNVTVEEGSAARVYRLHVDFGPIAQAIFDEAGRWYRMGRRFLPTHLTFGMNLDGAFATPDATSGPRRNISRK